MIAKLIVIIKKQNMLCLIAVSCGAAAGNNASASMASKKIKILNVFLLILCQTTGGENHSNKTQQNS